MRISIAACFLTFFASQAFADTPASSVVYTGAPFTQHQPAAATNGTDFLVAWRDNRFTLPNARPGQIYVARVASNGRLLDTPTAIALADPHDALPSSWTNSAPSVAWTGRVYIVAWHDFGSASMRTVRIDSDGTILDTFPRTLPNVFSMSYGAAASGPDAALITYGRSDSSVHAALFNGEGNVVSTDIALPHAKVDDSPVAASNGSSFYVAWRRWDGTQSIVMGVPVDRNGTLGTARSVAATWAGPLIASNGKDYLITYIDANKLLAAAHIGSDARAITTTRLPFKVSWPFRGALLSRYGNSYLLAVVDPQFRVSGVILGPTARTIGTIPLTTGATVQGAIALAGSATSALVAWPEARFGGTLDTDVFSRIVGAQSDETLLSRAAARQLYPKVASSPIVSLVVWLEYRGFGEGEVRATRLAANGTVLDREGIKLGDGVYDPPAVAFDGVNFVVAWRQARGAVYTNRVAPDGALLDGLSGRLAVPYAFDFGLGSNGEESILAWSSQSWPSPQHVRAARIGRDGALDQNAVLLSFSGRTAFEFDVAATADTWLIAWTDVVPRSCGICPSLEPLADFNIVAVRVNRSMNLVDATPIPIASNARHVAAAAGSDEFLLAWEGSGNVATVHARTVNAIAGTTGPDIAIAVGASPSVARVGADYAIAWQNAGDLFHTMFDHRSEITVLAASADEESHVALNETRTAALIFAYERVITDRIAGTVSRALIHAP
jgi:hypothetical protein